MKLYGVSAQFQDGYVKNLPIKANETWEAINTWRLLNRDAVKKHGPLVLLAAKLMSTSPQLDAGPDILRSDGTRA